MKRPTPEQLPPPDQGACILTAENMATEDDCTTHDHEPVIDTRPILDLTYVSGRLCIGVTELDENGDGVRAYVLSAQDEHTADRVMLRRFDDMARLMGDNVQNRKDLWLTEDEAADEADHRNAEDDFDNQAWQTAYVNVGLDGEEGYWTVTLENLDE